MNKKFPKKKSGSLGLMWICTVVFGLLCVSFFAAKIVFFQHHHNDSNPGHNPQIQTSIIADSSVLTNMNHVSIDHHTSHSSSLEMMIKKKPSPSPVSPHKAIVEERIRNNEGEIEKILDKDTKDINIPKGSNLHLIVSTGVHQSIENRQKLEDLNSISSNNLNPIIEGKLSTSKSDNNKNNNNNKQRFQLQLEDDGRGSHGQQWRPLKTMQLNDWLVYLRIQKTGSQTFWQTLQNSFDSSVWGRRSPCQKGLFCGDHCLKVVEEQISTILTSRSPGGGGGGGSRKKRMKDPNQCSLIFRGHINMNDYVMGFYNMMGNNSNIHQLVPPTTPTTPSTSLVTLSQSPSHRVFFITFLREPIARVVSEYRHITEGIVAQFGPHTFGAAWDYNFTFYPKMDIAKKRKLGTFANWIGCDKCRVGYRNRMTRFLGSRETTGQLLKEEEKEEEEEGSNKNDEVEADMLQRAKGVLETCLFLGIMERYEDSMLVLKHTFPQALNRMNSYSTSPHAKSKYVTKISKEEMALITSLNQLDVQLYDFAKTLFEQRFTSMKRNLPTDIAKLSFKKVKGPGSREIFRLQ